MSVNSLDKLLSDEFLLSLGVINTAVAMRRCLLRSQFVKQINAELRSGAITEARIQRFVQRLSWQFVPGQLFFHEPALAAIAVALESRGSPFSDEYLGDLAKLNRISEFHLAPGVAVLCKKHRMKSLVFQRQRFSSLSMPQPSNWEVRAIGKSLSIRQSDPTVQLRPSMRMNLHA